MIEQPITDKRLDDCEGRILRLEQSNRFDLVDFRDWTGYVLLFACIIVIGVATTAACLVLIHWVLATWGVVR